MKSTHRLFNTLWGILMDLLKFFTEKHPLKTWQSTKQPDYAATNNSNIFDVTSETESWESRSTSVTHFWSFAARNTTSSQCNSEVTRASCRTGHCIAIEEDRAKLDNSLKLHLQSAEEVAATFIESLPVHLEYGQQQSNKSSGSREQQKQLSDLFIIITLCDPFRSK